MIGRYLTLEDCSKSQTAINKGIDNTPPQEVITNLNQLAINVYDPLTDHFGFKIPFSSCYRSPALNKAIGGAKNSDHCKGLAYDFDLDNSGFQITNSALFMWAIENLQYKQIIWEHGTSKNPAWVHISYEKGNNKREILVATKVNGKTVYSPYKKAL